MLSGSYSGFHQFPGFSSPETDRQAALNWRRISILRGAAGDILAGVAGSAVLSNSAHSGGTACPSPQLGSRGSQRTRSLVSGDSPRSSLVVKLRTPRTQNLTRASVPPARLVVRRLGCRLGGAPRRPGRFRPLVSRGATQLHQPSGAAGNVLCSPAFSSSSPQHLSGGICGQHHGSGLPETSGRNQVCNTQPGGAGTTAMGGGPLYHSSATIYYGPQQRADRLAFLPESNSGI